MDKVLCTFKMCFICLLFLKVLFYFIIAKLLPVKTVLLWVGWQYVQKPQRMASSMAFFFFCGRCGIPLLAAAHAPEICGRRHFWKWI